MRFVAHGGGQDAGLDRGAVRFAVHGQFEFVRAVAALGQHQLHVRAVVETLDVHLYGQALDAWLQAGQAPSAQVRDHCRWVGRIDGPQSLARLTVESAWFEFAVFESSVHAFDQAPG